VRNLNDNLFSSREDGVTTFGHFSLHAGSHPSLEELVMGKKIVIFFSTRCMLKHVTPPIAAHP
jgi:hypothetical protein